MGSISHSTDTRTVGSDAGDFAFLLHPHSLAPASLRHSLSLSFIFWKKGTLLVPTLRSRIETGRSDADPARAPAPQKRSALAGLRRGCGRVGSHRSGHLGPLATKPQSSPGAPVPKDSRAPRQARSSALTSGLQAQHPTNGPTRSCPPPRPLTVPGAGAAVRATGSARPPIRVQGSDTALQPLGSR